jgi:hypothetical protein
MFYDRKGVGNYCCLYGVPHTWNRIATQCRHGKLKTWKGEDADEVFYKASDLILREFRKIFGQFTRVGLVRITFPVEEILR